MTRTDFVIYVLRRRMGVLGVSETPDSEDSETVLQALDLWYADLAERGLASWSNTDVPDRLADALGAYVEAMIWNLYMAETLSAEAQANAKTLASAKLHSIINRKNIDAPVEAEYF